MNKLIRFAGRRCWSFNPFFIRASIESYNHLHVFFLFFLIVMFQSLLHQGIN